MRHENDESLTGPSLNGSGAAPTPPSRLTDLLQQLGLDRAQGEETPQLARLLADLEASAWYTRAAAVLKLADLGERAPLDALLRALRDPHVSVRANAVHALARLGARAPVQRLIEVLLGDSEWQVRESAASALETLGTRAPAEPLLAALHDPDTSVRGAAQRALAHTHPDLLNTTQVSTMMTPSAPAKPLSRAHARRWSVADSGSGEHMHVYEKEESMPDNDFLPEITAYTNDQKPVPEPPRRRRRTWRVVSLSIAAAVVIVNLLAWSILTHALRSGGNAGSQVGAGVSPTAAVTQPPGATQSATGSLGKTIFVYPPVGTTSMGDFMSIGWSADGKYIALSELGVTLLNASNGKVVNTFGQANGSVWVSWAPHGTHLAVSSQNVQIWDAVTGQALVTYTPQASQASSQQHGGPLMQLSGGNIIHNSAWSPDGKLIASAVDGNAYGYDVQIWNASTGAYVRTLQLKANANYNDFIDKVAWSPDGKYIAASSGSNTNSVTVWDAATGQRLYVKQGASILDWAPNSDLLASGDNNGLIQVWQPTTGAVQYSFQGQPGVSISSLAWSPNGQYLAAGGSGVRVWEVANQKLFYVYPGHGKHQNLTINGLAWSPDSTEIASMGVGMDVTSPHTGIPLDSVRVWTI